MADPVAQVMDLACCDRDEAIEALSKSGNNVIDAVSLLMDVPAGRDAPKNRKLSKIQEFFKETREEMTKLTESISKGFSSNQSETSQPDEMKILPEEMVPQSGYLSQCHPVIPELEVKIPEIVCQSPSVCFSDLPLNDQRLPCSGQECHQSSPCLEKE